MTASAPRIRNLQLSLTDDGVLALSDVVSRLINRTTEPWSTVLRDISTQIDQQQADDWGPPFPGLRWREEAMGKVRLWRPDWGVESFEVVSAADFNSLQRLCRILGLQLQRGNAQ